MTSLAKILYVDDNPNYLRDILPMYGYEVIVATDGMQALKLLSNKDQDIDLIILDVMMPNMDGWEVLKTLRKDDYYSDMPIVMLTALDSEQKEVTGLKYGADDYITKPFSLPKLLARVEAILRRSDWKEKKRQTINVKLPFASDDSYTPLTHRELEVLQLVAQGANNQDIAEELVVQDVTIKAHLNSIFKKLKVTNRTQAVLLAFRLNLIE